MKKLLLLVLSITLVYGLNAQVRFGVKAGGTMSNMFTKIDGDKVDGYKAKFGFQGGGMMEYSFSESFALQPELLYVMNGAKVEDLTFDGNITLHNIQVPINLKYKMGYDNMSFFAMAGPYFGYIVGGKADLKNELRNTTTRTDIFDIEGMDMKRFDFGVGVSLGVEISKIMVGVGYQFGIANLTGVDKVTRKSGTFNLSVGYFF